MADLKDPQFQQFMEVESHRQRFQAVVHQMADECWDVCYQGNPGSKLDRKTETCTVNCVERFLDTSNYIVSRLEKEGQNLMSKDASMGDAGDSGFKWN